MLSPTPAQSRQCLTANSSSFPAFIFSFCMSTHPLNFLDGKSYANGRLILDIVCLCLCLRKRNLLKVLMHSERQPQERDEVMPNLSNPRPKYHTNKLTDFAPTGTSTSSRQPQPPDSQKLVRQHPLRPLPGASTSTSP